MAIPFVNTITEITLLPVGSFNIFEATPVHRLHVSPFRAFQSVYGIGQERKYWLINLANGTLLLSTSNNASKVSLATDIAITSIRATNVHKTGKRPLQD